LRDRRYNRVAHGFLELRTPRAIKGEGTIEPPGQNCRRNERQQTSGQRGDAKHPDDGENSNVGRKAKATDRKKPQRSRQQHGERPSACMEIWHAQCFSQAACERHPVHAPTTGDPDPKLEALPIAGIR
jgi:hypothetical protein